MGKNLSLDHPVFKIIRPDMYLNFVLGWLFIFAADWVENLLGSGALLPLIAWRVMGVLFLGFAVWQWGVLKRKQITSNELRFAGLMALGPVVFLTIALFMDFALFPLARAVLWIGNLYMFFLGLWYMKLAQ